MAAHQSKATKHHASGEAAPGPSLAGPSKKSKQSAKASSSKEEKTAAAQSKEELRLHQAIERSIQKAIKEASVREVTTPSAPGVRQPGLAPPVPPSAPESSQDQHQDLLPLSPDGRSYLSPLQGEVREAFFGAQSESTPPGADTDDPPPPTQPPAVQASSGGGHSLWSHHYP